MDKAWVPKLPPLAVMALVATRAQGELRRGETENLEKAVYWLHARTLFVDDLFTALSRNSDAQARALSASLLASAEELPAVEDPNLQPIAHDRGRDLTSGRISVRTSERAAAAAK